LGHRREHHDKDGVEAADGDKGGWRNDEEPIPPRRWFDGVGSVGVNIEPGEEGDTDKSRGEGDIAFGRSRRGVGSKRCNHNYAVCPETTFGSS